MFRDTKLRNSDPASKAPPTFLRGLIEWYTLKPSFIRGFLGALALFAAVTNYNVLSGSELTKGVLAVLVGWNSITGFVGLIIGKIPHFPTMSSGQVNWIIFVSSVGVPAVHSLYSLFNLNLRHATETIFGKMFFFAGLISFGYIFVVGSYVFFTGVYSQFQFPVPNSYSEVGLGPFPAYLTYFCFFTMSLVYPFFVAMMIKTYRAGVLWLLGFLLALQMLHLAPIIGEPVRMFSSFVLSDT